MLQGGTAGCGSSLDRARDDLRRVLRPATADEPDGEAGLGIVYLYGYNDEWRVDIRVENILSATAGVAYPRCTGGRATDIPGEGCRDVWEFNADRRSASSLSTVIFENDLDAITYDTIIIDAIIALGLVEGANGMKGRRQPGQYREEVVQDVHWK